MKLSHIAAAIAATVSCGFAYAAPHNALPVTGTEMYFSGSTAADPLFKAFMAKNCDSNTLDAYRSDTSLGNTQYLYVCSSAGGFGSSTGPKGFIIVHKSGTSSSNGVTPVANQVAQGYMTQTDVASATSAGKFTETDVAATSVLGAYESFITTIGAITDTGSVIPDVGVSDVEPKFFTTSTVYGKLTSTKDYVLIFGVMASVTARNQLQTIQGLTSGSDAIANIPSLTKSDLSSIYEGKINDLQSLGAATSFPIHLSTRSTGSGTTKTFDITFINAACGGQATAAPAQSSAGSTVCNATAGFTNVTTGTSEDMEACMNNYNTAGLAAFGEISTDYQPATTDGWRFIKVDGYAPEQINTTEGRYPLWAEGTFNVLASAPPSGAKGAILATLQGEAGNPTTLSALNTGLTQPIEGYNAGFLVLNTNTAALDSLASFPLTAAEIKADPVSLVGRGIDSCSFPVESFGTDPLGGAHGYTPQ